MASNKKEKEQVDNFYSKESEIINIIDENKKDFSDRFYKAFDIKYLTIDEQNDIIETYDNAINPQLNFQSVNENKIDNILNIVTKTINRKAKIDDLAKIIEDQQKYGFKMLEKQENEE